MKVIKRDGKEVNFDAIKISEAVKKAFIAVDGKTSDEAEAISKEIATDISNELLSSDENISVEEIQNMVENHLMETDRKDVARAYITYRNMRTRTRERNSQFNKELFEKLTASNVQNQNANVDEYSFGGRMGEARDAVTKKFALDFIVSDMARKNHENNEIYIHDLSSYAVGQHNCLSVPIDQMLENGFWTRNMDVRPAQSISTAFQLVAVIFQLQSLEQFGGVSATHIDWSMVPYVRKSFFKHYVMNYLKNTEDFENLGLYSMSEEELDDWVDENRNKLLEKMGMKKEDFTFANKAKMNPYLYKCALFDTRRETYQAVEAMYHNLNTLQSRSGGQLNWLAS